MITFSFFRQDLQDFMDHYSISPFPACPVESGDGREKIQSRHCGKRNPKPSLINLYETGILGLIPSREEG
jgi:hypothetical protein